MAEGGGFCERHGPFDPPNLTCPFCALEDQRRRAYGPPPGGSPRPPAGEQPEPAEPAAGFVRQTVEPGRKLGATELVPRQAAVWEDEAGDDDQAAPAPSPLGWLIIKEPLERRGEIVRVQANQIIGRNGDLQWDDPRLSRQHARLTLEPSEDSPGGPPVFHLWPFGPTNPVYINGREVRGATPLHENDEVRLGDTLFVFKVLVD
jgi:hypothetical protein